MSQRPRGCPSCAIIQSIPCTALGGFSLYQALQVARGGGSRSALPLGAFGLGYLVVGYKAYHETLNPPETFYGFYPLLGGAMGLGTVGLAHTQTIRTTPGLYSNILGIGFCAVTFFSIRGYLLYKMYTEVPNDGQQSQ